MSDLPTFAVVVQLKDETLRDLTTLVRRLDRQLASIEADAAQARAALAAGNMPAGTMGFGPIGHQAPFDVAQTTDRLSAAVTLARHLGASVEEIQAACTKKGF